jgi:two-component system response regulator AlgR
MNGPIRTIIADDEPLARDLLRALLQAVGDVEIVGEAANGDALVGLVRSDPPDLVFLDINMPRRDGLQAAFDFVGPARPELVFVTGFPQRAVEAFEAGAADYILKPVGAARLGQALERVRERLSRRPARPADPVAPVDIWIPSGSGRIKLALADIRLVEAQRDYVRLHAGEKQYLVRARISDLAPRLEGYGLHRIHRSTIVRLADVRAVRRVPKGLLLLMADGVELRASRNYVAGLPLPYRGDAWSVAVQAEIATPDPYRKR